jgi:hypothetical protein
MIPQTKQITQSSEDSASELTSINPAAHTNRVVGGLVLFSEVQVGDTIQFGKDFKGPECDVVYKDEETINLDPRDYEAFDATDLEETPARYVSLADPDSPPLPYIHELMRSLMRSLIRKIATMDPFDTHDPVCKWCDASFDQGHFDGCPWVIAKSLDQSLERLGAEKEASNVQ